jgi:membrane protease YdiL (CAAX protease family)
MTAADGLYLTLIVILSLLDYFVFWPAFLRRSQANRGAARIWLWSGWMIMLWTLLAAGVTLWLLKARPWGPLGLVLPHGWRLWGAVGLLLALVLTYARTVTRLARCTRPRRVKVGHPHVLRLIPETRSELSWWVGLSLSAGICEEFVFRGYLLWAFQPMLGLWGAAALSVMAFAAAHAYQGAKGVLATGVVGGLLTLVVLMTGSLLPAMALHALIDIEQGLVAWLVVRRAGESGRAAELVESTS